MRRWIAFIVLAGIVLPVAAACSHDKSSGTATATVEEAEATDTPASSVTYTLDFNASAAGDAGIDVGGTTNLPDGALIRVSASRAFRNQGEADTRAVSASSNRVTVTGGEFSTTLHLDESDLLVGVGDVLGVIEIVSQSVTVCVEFATGEDFNGQQEQPDPSVVEAVGPFGERLASSPQVTVFGSATANPSNWLEVKTSVGLRPPLLDEIAALQGRAPTIGALEGFCL